MAISFDATANSSSAGTASLSYSHTCSTSANRILFVSAFCTGGDQVTGITYNSVSMTQVGKVNKPASTEWVYQYYLIAPATGTNTVTISFSGSPATARSVSTSYIGAKQSGVPDASTTNSNTASSSITTTVTTILDRCWTMLTAYTDGGSITAGSGSTVRGTNGSALGAFDSNGQKTPAGSTSMTVTATAGTNSTIMCSFAPYLENVTITETVTMTDTITTLRKAISTILDTITLTETITARKGKFTTILETITTSDTITAVIKWLRQTKNTSTLTGGTKHSATWDEENKNTSTLTNQTKN